MSSAPAELRLDSLVFPLRERLRVAGAPAPDVLFFLATGVGFLPSRLGDPWSLELGELAADCEPWSSQVLHAGTLGKLRVWCLEDTAGEPLAHPPVAPWRRALPVWLAAAAGAVVCVHTSAGSALPDGDGSPARLSVPGFALLSDHVNFLGESPLVGLGESKLGPLFPDLSRLHHPALRKAALARAAQLGLPAAEAVAACTHGPALETPAERVLLARLGAQVSVPGLSLPLLAAGHAGLALLALVAVTDAPAGATEVGQVLAAAGALQPGLEDWLIALAPDLEDAVESLVREERS